MEDLIIKLLIDSEPPGLILHVFAPYYDYCESKVVFVIILNAGNHT